MTPQQFLADYWPWLVFALGLVILLGALLTRARGQRVSLTERDTSTRTLERPVATPSPAPVPLLVDSELTRLKGVGPKLAAALASEGVLKLADLAALDGDQQAALDARLGTFAGRVARDRLTEQARLLTADPAAYQSAFGKGTAG